MEIESQGEGESNLPLSLVMVTKPASVARATSMSASDGERERERVGEGGRRGAVMRAASMAWWSRMTMDPAEERGGRRLSQDLSFILPDWLEAQTHL